MESLPKNYTFQVFLNLCCNQEKSMFKDHLGYILKYNGVYRFHHFQQILNVFTMHHLKSALFYDFHLTSADVSKNNSRKFIFQTEWIYNKDKFGWFQLAKATHSWKPSPSHFKGGVLSFPKKGGVGKTGGGITYFHPDCPFLMLSFLFADMRVLLVCHIRGGSRTAAKSKMECFVIIVKGWKSLTITKSAPSWILQQSQIPLCTSILDV